MPCLTSCDCNTLNCQDVKFRVVKLWFVLLACKLDKVFTLCLFTLVLLVGYRDGKEKEHFGAEIFKALCVSNAVCRKKNYVANIFQLAKLSSGHLVFV